MTVNVTKPEINLREKLAELDKPSGIAGEAMLRADTPQEQFNLIGAGRKNLIINGAMQVSQRGNYTSATSITSGYHLDRWFVAPDVVTATLQQTTDMPSGFSGFSQKVVATSSVTGEISCFQKIEDYNIAQNQTITLSAWVKSNTANARFLLYSGTGFISIADVHHSGNGSWEKLSVTVDLSSSTLASGFRPYLAIRSPSATSVAVTSGDYIQFTQVQLELGSVATPFEHRSYGEELALCQRYYIDLNLSGLGMGNAYSVNAWTYQEIPLPVTMRAVPTVTYTGGSLGPWATSSITRGVASISPDFINVYGKASGAILDYYVSGAFNIQADAEL